MTTHMLASILITREDASTAIRSLELLFQDGVVVRVNLGRHDVLSLKFNQDGGFTRSMMTEFNPDRSGTVNSD